MFKWHLNRKNRVIWWLATELARQKNFDNHTNNDNGLNYTADELISVAYRETK